MYHISKVPFNCSHLLALHISPSYGIFHYYNTLHLSRRFKVTVNLGDCPINALQSSRAPNDRKCFQMRQKCLKWFSLGHGSQFGQFRAAINTVHLFGSLRGTSVVSNGFFVSSRPVSFPHGHGRTFEGVASPYVL